MNLAKIIDLSLGIRKIAETEMPFALAYKITKLAEIVDKNEQFYNTKVRELLDVYAEKDEEGNLIENEDRSIRLKLDTVDEFNTKLDELRAVKVSDELPTFKAAELETLSISPRDLYFLIPLITE